MSLVPVLALQQAGPPDITALVAEISVFLGIVSAIVGLLVLTHKNGRRSGEIQTLREQTNKIEATLLARIALLESAARAHYENFGIHVDSEWKSRFEERLDSVHQAIVSLLAAYHR